MCVSACVLWYKTFANLTVFKAKKVILKAGRGLLTCSKDKDGSFPSFRKRGTYVPEEDNKTKQTENKNITKRKENMQPCFQCQVYGYVKSIPIQKKKPRDYVMNVSTGHVFSTFLQKALLGLS